MLVRRATRAKGPEVGLEKGTPLTVPCTQVTTIRNTRETGLVVLTGPVSDVSTLAGTCEWGIRAPVGYTCTRMSWVLLADTVMIVAAPIDPVPVAAAPHH